VIARDLVAEHGSPLWVVNLDVLRDRWRTLASAWRSVWPDVQIAYSHKANRHPAIVAALAAEGAGHQVSSKAEYEAARSLGHADGRSVVVHGSGIARALLERAAADGALVVVDSRGELERATAAGVQRLGVRVATAGGSHGPALYGVPVAEVATLLRAGPAGAPAIEALAMHLVPSGFSRPPADSGGLASSLTVVWPHTRELYATSARACLAGDAARRPRRRRRRRLPAGP